MLDAGKLFVQRCRLQIPLPVARRKGIFTPCKYYSPSETFYSRKNNFQVIAPEEPPPPPRVVVIFEANKQKECFELIDENPEDVLNIGFFSSADPDQATPLCATPDQYAKIPQFE